MPGPCYKLLLVFSSNYPSGSKHLLRRCCGVVFQVKPPTTGGTKGPLGYTRGWSVEDQLLAASRSHPAQKQRESFEVIGPQLAPQKPGGPSAVFVGILSMCSLGFHIAVLCWLDLEKKAFK